MLWLLLGLGAGVLASVLVFNWRERRQLKALTPARRESAADQRLEQEESHEDIDDRWEWGVEMVMRRSTLLDDRQCPARMGNKPSRLVITGNQTATLAVLLATRQGGLTVDDHQAVGDQVSQWEASGAIRLPASAVPPFSDLVRRARQAEADIADLDGQLIFHLRAEEPASSETILACCEQLGLSQRGEGRFSMLDEDGQIGFSLLPADQGLMLSFLLDLPRVCDPESWFVEMAETARRLAEALDAEIVDDRGMVLTEQAMGLIREQVRQRAETLTEAGLRPGGVLARGIFQ
ncbi:MAG: hypothetical protein NWS21_00920 [Burkholderiaceae bacterium]|nr:hypothetical protein [Burkholderiaceae bacterium]